METWESALDIRRNVTETRIAGTQQAPPPASGSPRQRDSSMYVI